VKIASMPSLQLEWVVLATLLAASACFSATETALFSLSPHERRRAGSFSERLFYALNAVHIIV